MRKCITCDANLTDKVFVRTSHLYIVEKSKSDDTEYGFCEKCVKKDLELANKMVIMKLKSQQDIIRSSVREEIQKELEENYSKRLGFRILRFFRIL